MGYIFDSHISKKNYFRRYFKEECKLQEIDEENVF